MKKFSLAILRFALFGFVAISSVAWGQRRVEYLISGAGPSGLASAISLHLQGHSVLVVEKRDPNSDYAVRPQILGLTSESRNYLLELGISRELFSRPQKYVFYRNEVSEPEVYTVGYSRIARAMTWAFQRHQPENLIETGKLEAALLARFQQLGGVVEFRSKISLQEGTRARINFDQAASEEVDYKWLIDAEGSKSDLLQAVNETRVVDESWDGLTISGRRLDDSDLSEVRFSLRPRGTEDFASMFVVSKAGRFSAALDLRGRNIAGWENASPQDLLREVGFIPEQLEDIRKQRITVQLSHLQKYYFPDHRMFVIGEAAHSVSPFSALGVNLALRESAFLTRQFRSGTELSAQQFAAVADHMGNNVRESWNTNRVYHQRAVHITHGNPTAVNALLGILGRLSKCRLFLYRTGF